MYHSQAYILKERTTATGTWHDCMAFEPPVKLKRPPPTTRNVGDFLCSVPHRRQKITKIPRLSVSTRDPPGSTTASPSPVRRCNIRSRGSRTPAHAPGGLGFRV